MSNTTQSHPRIQLDQHRERTEWFGAVPGAMYRGSCVRRSATGTYLATGSAVSASVVRGKWFLDPFSLFPFPGPGRSPDRIFFGEHGGHCSYKPAPARGPIGIQRNSNDVQRSMSLQTSWQKF